MLRVNSTPYPDYPYKTEYSSSTVLACLKDVIKTNKKGIAKGEKRMSFYVLGFQDMDKTKRLIVGGKGANLGELSKIQ